MNRLKIIGTNLMTLINWTHCNSEPVLVNFSFLQLYLQLDLAVPRRGVDEAHGVRHAPVPVVQLHSVHRVARLMLGQLRRKEGRE